MTDEPDELDEDGRHFADDGLSIPPITDPMGRHWKQPSIFEIAVDSTHAMMSQETLDELPTYDASFPSGVYTGKMWKRRWSGGWLLMWYGKMSSNVSVWTFNREILIV